MLSTLLFLGNYTHAFIGINMRAHTEFEFTPLNESNSLVNNTQEELQFEYAYGSNGAKVTFRSLQNRKYGKYDKICAVVDNKGVWMDKSWHADTGYVCIYPSICEQIPW